ncbi:hypothetical protein [Halorubrum yunnanense]|uniref:Uncharacterized protein n=1 Tax=Halorubrum yunnanense TaxID=1526162 RepID=A0ABD5YDK4_9EURY|nr:hypothetical protein [Halorubrum yunnanense]
MSDSTERARGEPAADDPALGAGTSTPEAAAPGADDRAWLARAWYRSRLGIVIVAVDVLLTVTLTAAASVNVGAQYAGIDGLGPGIVPPFVPLFSLLGGLGFVSTALIERFDASVGRLLQYNLRLPAALPLGVGVYLLSDLVLGQGVDDVPLVVGVVFLSGLYVNLAYKRLGALARRLLPAGSDRGDGRETGGAGE